MVSRLWSCAFHRRVTRQQDLVARFGIKTGVAPRGADAVQAVGTEVNADLGEDGALLMTSPSDTLQRYFATKNH